MLLVTAEFCPFSQRCILALTAKGLLFEILEMDLDQKSQFPELLSPYDRVPVLKHDDETIYESSVINEYLEDAFPDPPLLPAEPGRRAAARFWIDCCNSRFMPAYFNLLKAPPGDKRNQLKTRLLACLEFIDQGLESRYWMGKDIGLVDITFYPFFNRFAAVEEFRGIEIPPGLRRLQAWLETMRAHPLIATIATPREQVVECFRPFYAD